MTRRQNDERLLSDREPSEGITIVTRGYEPRRSITTQTDGLRRVSRSQGTSREGASSPGTGVAAKERSRDRSVHDRAGTGTMAACAGQQFRDDASTRRCGGSRLDKSARRRPELRLGAWGSARSLSVADHRQRVWAEAWSSAGWRALSKFGRGGGEDVSSLGPVEVRPATPRLQRCPSTMLFANRFASGYHRTAGALRALSTYVQGRRGAAVFLNGLTA